MPATSEKRRTFRALHQSGCFVMPNPWDVGSARWLQHLGAPALATTSAGAAFALGLPDSDRVLTRDLMLAHVRVIVQASDLPVNADFGSGYAREPEGVAESVRLCVATGVSGLSVEDATDDPQPLFDFALAVERVRAAREAIDATGADVVLTARSECFLVGHPQLDEVVRRLRAFADAGADCLYAPGLRTGEEISVVVAAVSPKPVNVLVPGPNWRTADLAGLGVRRVSVGSGLARVAWGAFMRSAEAIVRDGVFASFGDAAPYAQLDGFFRDDVRRRGS